MMNKEKKYHETDYMSGLVTENYPVLLIMSRFGIGLGFGEKNIREVCEENGVDTDTFLTVVNMLFGTGITDSSVRKVSVASLLSYLHSSHDYFLGFRLPGIREKLFSAVGGDDDLSQAIRNYFDEYVAEVDRHMSYEEKKVFPYVKKLLEGIKPDDYSIDVFGRQHDQVEARLREFKNIIIKYYPSESTNEINGVLFDIFNCQNDLAAHNDVEDMLFVPAVSLLEQKITSHR